MRKTHTRSRPLTAIWGSLMFVRGTQIYLAIFSANLWPFIYKNANVLYYYGLQNQILKNTAMFFFVCSAVKLVCIFHLIHAFYCMWVVFCIVNLFHAFLINWQVRCCTRYGFSEIHHNENILAQIGISFVIILRFRLRNTAAMFIWLLINTKRILA